MLVFETFSFVSVFFNRVVLEYNIRSRQVISSAERISIVVTGDDINGISTPYSLFIGDLFR